MDGLRIAGREVQIDEAARVANHHFTEQRAQSFAVAGIARVAARDELLLEVGLGLEMPRREQRQQVVQFDEVVLDGSRRQQKHEPALERVHHLPVQRRSILAVMGFIDDDQVPLLRGDQCRSFLRLGRRERHQDAILAAPVFGLVGFGGLRRDREVQVELAVQFVLPLRDQRRGNEDQHALDQRSQDIFPQQQTGFDRLPQTDFIGQQHAPAKLTQYTPHGLDLMRQMLDAGQSFEAQQFVKPAQQAEARVFQVEPQVACPTARFDGRERVRLKRHRDAASGQPPIAGGDALNDHVVRNRRGWRGWWLRNTLRCGRCVSPQAGR